MSGILDRIGDYTIREQTDEEIHGGEKIPFDLCGTNPYDHYHEIRRFVAERNGEEIGEGWTMASRYQRWGYLGHYGIYADEHKRKGLGGRLLELCVSAMKDARMEVMFIDTGPSIAHRVYEKYGFVDAVPDHPEWLGLSFDGRSLREYLDGYYKIDDETAVEVRPLDFSHLIEIQALLNGWVGEEILVKNYLLTLFHDDQVHLGQILVEIPNLSRSPEQRQIRMLGLFAGSRLIGFSTIAPWRQTQWDNGHEAHIGLMDIYLHPSAWRLDRCRILFQEIKQVANTMGVCILRAMETTNETLKTEAFLGLGFRVKFEMHNELLFGEGEPERGVYPSHRMESLAVYEVSIGEPWGFTHPFRHPWDY